MAAIDTGGKTGQRKMVREDQQTHSAVDRSCMAVVKNACQIVSTMLRSGK